MRRQTLPYPVLLSKEVPTFAFCEVKPLAELRTAERPELSHSDAYSRKLEMLPASETDDCLELFADGLRSLCANI